MVRAGSRVPIKLGLSVCGVLAVGVLSGCLGERESAPEGSADEATRESLLEAYAALESAAEDVPNARLPRIDTQGEVVIIGPGESYDATSPPHDLGLFDYFAEREITFGLALIEDGNEFGAALSGIEFTNAPDSIELIIPKELRHGSARELLSGGATFAAISPSREIYCIDDADVGVESCPAPDLPQERGASENAQDPNRDEPEIPRGAELCADIEVDGEFVGFRMLAENLSCGKAKLVMAAAVDDSAPQGWSCSSGPGTLVECRKGEASIAFNE